MRLTLFLFGLLFLITSCNRDLRSDRAQLMGNDWYLTELGGVPFDSLADVQEHPFIQFDEEHGQVMGSAGCNSFSGGLRSDRSSYDITFRRVISTKMACADMTVEQQFLQMLNTATAFTMDEGQLVLLNEETPLARFEPRTGG